MEKKIYRRKIENPLKCSQYRYLVDNSMDAIILTAADGEIFFANRAACELFGMTELELIQGGRQAIMPISPKTRYKVLTAIEKSGQFLGELEFQKKDGTIFGAEISASAFISQGERQLFCAIVRDITHRKIAEQEFMESEARFRMIAENMTEGLLLLSADKGILTWNKGAEKITGIKAEDVVGKMLIDIACPGVHRDGSPYEHGQTPTLRAMKTGVPVKNEILGIVRPSGNVRWILSTATPLFHPNEDTPYLVGTSFTDITVYENAKQELEHQISKRTGQLEEMNTALKVLVQSREHELDEIEEKIFTNCNAIILPLLNRLKTGLKDRGQKSQVDIIHQTIQAILSPFSKKLADPTINLTPKETQIAAMITQGLSNKEMAQILNNSVRTITNHRDNIRTKLKLKNKKINLRTYLSSL